MCNRGDKRYNGKMTLRKTRSMTNPTEGSPYVSCCVCQRHGEIIHKNCLSNARVGAHEKLSDSGEMLRKKVRFLNYRVDDDTNHFNGDMPFSINVKEPARSLEYLVHCKKCFVKKCLLCNTEHNSGNAASGRLPNICVRCLKWSYGSSKCHQDGQIEKLCNTCKEGSAGSSIDHVPYNEEAHMYALEILQSKKNKSSDPFNDGSKLCRLMKIESQSLRKNIAELTTKFLIEMNSDSGSSVEKQLELDNRVCLQQWFEDTFYCYRDDDKIFSFRKNFGAKKNAGSDEVQNDGLCDLLKKDMRLLFLEKAWLNDGVINFVIHGLLNLCCMVECSFPSDIPTVSFANSHEALRIRPNEGYYEDLCTDVEKAAKHEQSLYEWFWDTSFKKHAFSSFCDRSRHLPEKRIIPVNIGADSKKPDEKNHWVLIEVTFPCADSPYGNVRLLNHLRPNGEYNSLEKSYVCWFAKFYGLFFKRVCGVDAGQLDYSKDDFEVDCMEEWYRRNSSPSRESNKATKIIPHSSLSTKISGESGGFPISQQTDGYSCGIHVIQDCCEAVRRQRNSNTDGTNAAMVLARDFRILLCTLMKEIYGLVVVPPVENPLHIDFYLVSLDDNVEGSMQSYGKRRNVLKDLAGAYYIIFNSYDGLYEKKDEISAVLDGDTSDKCNLVRKWCEENSSFDSDIKKVFVEKLRAWACSGMNCSILDILYEAGKEESIEKREEERRYCKVAASSCSKMSVKCESSKTSGRTLKVVKVQERNKVPFRRIGSSRRNIGAISSISVPHLSFESDEIFADELLAENDNDRSDIVSLVKSFFLLRLNLKVLKKASPVVSFSKEEVGERIQNAMQQFNTYFLIDRCYDESEVPSGLQGKGLKPNDIFIIKCAAIVEHKFELETSELDTESSDHSDSSYEDISIVHWLQTRNVRMENCGYATYLLSSIYRQTEFFPNEDRRVFFVSQPDERVFSIVNASGSVDKNLNHHRFLTDTKGGENAFTPIYEQNDSATRLRHDGVYKALLFPATISYRKIKGLLSSDSSHIVKKGGQDVLCSDLYKDGKICTVSIGGYAKVKYENEKLMGFHNLFGWTSVRSQQQSLISKKVTMEAKRIPGNVVNNSSPGCRSSMDSAISCEKLFCRSFINPPAYLQTDDGKLCTWLTAALLIRLRSVAVADKMINIALKCNEAGVEDLNWIPFMPTHGSKGFSLYELLNMYTKYDVTKVKNLGSQSYFAFAMNTSLDLLLLCQLEDMCGTKSHCVGISTRYKVIFDCNEKHALLLSYQSLQACVGQGKVFKRICYMVSLKATKSRRRRQRNVSFPMLSRKKIKSAGGHKS